LVEVSARIRSRRTAAVLLAAAAVTGATLGLAFSRSDAKGPLADGPAAVLARGSFKTVSWSTTGSAVVVRDSAGHVTLRFSGDFRTQRAPELFVHVGSRRIPLQRAWGAQSYPLSHAGPRVLDATVQVFCEKCNKAWGEARLRPVRRRAEA
jgi:hypothetical protein